MTGFFFFITRFNLRYALIRIVKKKVIAIFLFRVLMYQKREISLPLGYKTARPKTVDFEWPDVLARILVPFLTSITSR